MYSLARKNGEPAQSTIGERLDAMRRQLVQGLEAAKRRDHVFIEHFNDLIETVDQLRSDAPAAVLGDDRVKYHDDCQRIQKILNAHYGEQKTLRECEKLWLIHSDSAAACWLVLPESDEELACRLKSGFTSDFEPTF